MKFSHEEVTIPGTKTNILHLAGASCSCEVMPTKYIITNKDSIIMKQTSLLKTLFLLCSLIVGSSAWAEDVYTILYGTATYTGETITGVTPQTEFTADDGTVVSNYSHDDGNGNTAAMPVTGSVLASEASFS